MHLSRLAEEIVIWMTPQFGFVRLSDKFTTGSSIMPQKRNPDAAELVRAKVGRIAGAFQALLMVMKGLPLAYAKDMQEDKEPAFDALDALKLGIAAMTGMVDDLEPDRKAMSAPPRAGYSTATDLADWLVRELGPAVPRGPPRHRPDRGAGRVQGRDARQAAAGGHANRSSRGSPRTCFPCSSRRIGQKPDQLWGNRPSNVKREARRWIKRLEKDGQTR